MSWSNNIETALVITVAVVAVAGIAASMAIFVQIVRQGGWKLAEPSIIRSRWTMVRPWMLAGAVVGLLFGIAFVFLGRIEPTPPAAPQDAIISLPTEIKTQPRDGGQPTE